VFGFLGQAVPACFLELLHAETLSENQRLGLEIFGISGADSWPLPFAVFEQRTARAPVAKRVAQRGDLESLCNFDMAASMWVESVPVLASLVS
jgi:hypothetical protein